MTAKAAVTVPFWRHPRVLVMFGLTLVQAALFAVTITRA